MRKARGFAAMVAVFILVVLGGFGAVLVTVFSAQQRSSAFDSLGIQAYQAARTGIELGAFRATAGGGCASVPASFAVGAMNVNLQCAATNHDEASQTVTIYQITSTACNRTACPSDADGVTYVERQMRATVTNAVTGGA
jgi:MSHA biogenesis protein MshP